MRTSRERPGSGRSPLAFGFVGLGVLLVLGLVGLHGLVVGALPWLGADEVGDDATTVAEPASATPAGATPAEEVVSALIAMAAPTLDGWDPQAVRSSPATATFGFGCAPRDGWAATSARSQRFESDDRALTVSVSAYPAGVGAAVFAGQKDAASDCRSASLSRVSELGVEATGITSGRTRALVVRRGDVMLSVFGQRARGAEVEALASSLDTALAGLLASRCAAVDSTVADLARNPYVDLAGYRPLTSTVTVPRPDVSDVVPAERRTLAPAPQATAPPSLTSISYFPDAPSPAPTAAPRSLPASLPRPSAPVEPVAPTAAGEVERAVVDERGPGCGWAFTGTVAPVFDVLAANDSYVSARAEVETAMVEAWEVYQADLASYYDAWNIFVSASAEWNAYAERVNEIADQWRAIEDARRDYRAALADYDDAVEAATSWDAARASAERVYATAVTECEAAAAAPPASPPAAPPASPGQPGATPSTDTPQPARPPEPAVPVVPQCPPERPEILDEQRPVVPQRPVPPSAAQLPTAA